MWLSRLFSCLRTFIFFFFFSSRRRHTRSTRDWSSDVCSSDLASEEKARELRVEPLGGFVGSAVAGVDPRVMGIGPVPAVRKLLERTGVDVEQVDLVELNEAFASQSLVVLRELELDHEKVNVNGGAIAPGHPLWTSGARPVVSLLPEL